MVYSSIFIYTKEGLIHKNAIMVLMVSPPEQERFKVFRKRKEQSYLHYKDQILIIIYGAYNPPATKAHLGEKERLEKLKNRLKEDGYQRTYLVDDFEGNNEGDTALAKSLDALVYADLNIFLFTCRGKTGSVGRELTEAIKKKILWKCLVYEEVYEKSYIRITAMETLLKDDLKDNRYSPIEVMREDDDELYRIASSEVFQFLKKYVERLTMC